MRPPSLSSVLGRFDTLSLVPFLGRPWDMTLYGVRSRERRAGAWDDLIGVFFQDDENRVHHYTFQATTDPGAYWLEKLGNEDGTAILIADRQYRGFWEWGLHRGRYPALVQRGQCAIVRDRNRDEVLDIEPLIAGGRILEGPRTLIGLNLHRAEEDGAASEVHSWSAGCQVVRLPWEFSALRAILKMQERNGLGGRYSYALLNEWR